MAIIRDVIGGAFHPRDCRSLEIVWIVQACAPNVDRSVQSIATAGQPPALLLPARRQRPLQLLQYHALIRPRRENRLYNVEALIEHPLPPPRARECLDQRAVRLGV
jgi:hypothetical protein